MKSTKLGSSFFFVVKICQNVKKGASKSPFGKKWIKKKSSPYSDLSKAQDAIHGVDPLLPTLQGTHPSLPHSLK